MPLAISQEQLGAPPSVLRKKTWTRKDCEALQKSGFLNNERYELIEGQLIDTWGASPRHSTFRVYVGGWLSEVFGSLRVRQHFPIVPGPDDYSTNEAIPDVCVTSEPATYFFARHPNPADILLLVEVADTTLDFDTTTKAGLYARAGITDYWVLDVNNRRIIVHRSTEAGTYRYLTVYDASEPVSPLAAPEASLRLADSRL